MTKDLGWQLCDALGLRGVISLDISCKVSEVPTMTVKSWCWGVSAERVTTTVSRFGIVPVDDCAIPGCSEGQKWITLDAPILGLCERHHEALRRVADDHISDRSTRGALIASDLG